MGGVQVCSNIFMILRLGGELRDKISVIVWIRQRRAGGWSSGL